MSSPVLHYCQKCLAANPLGQDFCTRCGTRLMIIVEPSSAKFEVGEAALSSDEHLLERISATENRVARLTERLERSLDLLVRQAQNSYFDRSLVKALIDLLSEDKLVQPERLERLWNERCQKDALEQEESIQREELRLGILAAAMGPDRKAFENLVNEGFLLIEAKKTDSGIELLKRAADLCTVNSQLNIFIGEHFFRRGKARQSFQYLERAHQAEPQDMHVSLLLGLTYAELGEAALAKELLNGVTKRGGSSFAGHYGLGWLFVAERKWSKALNEFKQALSTRPSPEAHYVLGYFYFETERFDLAARHLLKAVEMDDDYEEALQLLAIVYERNGESDLAAKTIARCAAVKPRRASAAGERRKRIAPLFQISKKRSVHLITGTDKRLSETVREDALRVFAERNPHSG